MATLLCLVLLLRFDLEILFGRESPRTQQYAEALYARKQRQGMLYRDCVRLVTYDRNVFAASVVAAGHADAMVTGVTRHYSVALADVRNVIDTVYNTRGRSA